MQTIKFARDCGGRWVIPRDPDSRWKYGINLARPLAALTASIASAEVVDIVGVNVESPTAPNIASPHIWVWVTGGDAALGLNSMTIRYVLSDGTEGDQTLYFNIEQN